MPTPRYRPDTTALRSDVAPWERFLADIGAGRRGSLPPFRLPKPPPGSPEAVLSQAETGYENRLAQARALGVDDSGEGAPGLLSTVARGLDYPRALLFSAGHEIADLLGGGDGASFDDFRRQLDERRGFGDIQELRMADDDSWLERGAKGLTAFIGDVVTDPLTYVSFGAASVGRKAASELAEAGVRSAAKRLPGETVEAFAERSLAARAARAGTGDVADDLAESLGRRTIEPPPTWKGTAAEWRRSVGEAELAGRASEEFLRGGSRGLRRWLDDEFGEAGEAIFDALPSEVRGGLRLRVPFARDRATGAPRSLDVGRGGGRLSERVGLGQLTGMPAAMRNRLRSSRLGRAVADRLGGADGKLYGQVVADLARDPDDLGRATFAMYAAARRARTEARAYGRALHGATVGALGWIEQVVRTAPDEAAARAARERWFMDPDALRSLSDEALDAMDPSERAGAAAALAAHDYLASNLGRLRELGLSVGEIDAYVPRVLTGEERAARRTVGRRRSARAAGGYDPTRGRERYVTVDVVEDANGQPATRWRWLTPDEANAASGRAVFETDPVRIVASYGDAARRLAVRTRFANLLADAGVLARGATEPGGVLSARRLRSLSDLAEGTGEDWRRALLGESAETVDPGKVGELNATLDRLAADRDALAQAVATAASSPNPPDQIGALVEGLLDVHARAVGDAERAVKAGVEGAGERLTQARAAHRRALRASTGVRGTAARPTEGTGGLFDAGLRELGVGPNAPTLPPELAESFAPEVVAETVERFYRASRPQSDDVAAIIDSFYGPYYRLFKTYATVGRGPGYHVRNLLGGVWNNWLADVTRADYDLSTKLLRERRRALTDVTSEQAGRLARELSIDPADAQRRLDPTRLAEAAEDRLRQATEGVQVARGVSLYDVHRAMEDQSVGFGSKVREGLHDVLEGDVDVLEWARGGGERNLFRGRTRDELNRVQRGANRLASNRWVRGNASAAQLSENFLRGATFVAGVRRYGLDDGGRSAGLLTKAVQFDYDDLSDFERRWLRGFAIPFWTWTSRNVPLQLRALAREPGKINRLLHANEALRDVFGDDSEDVVPEWMRERLGWVSRATFGGSPIVVGIESPVTDLNEWIKVGAPGDMLEGGARELTSALSPVIKAPLELLLGVNTFTGAPFDPGGVEAPAWYSALPFVPKRTDAQGRVRMPEWLAQTVRNTLPPVGQADRALGLSASSRERLPTSLLSQLAPVVATSTLTPRQKAGELRARTARLGEAIDWSGASPETLEQARALLDMGLPPESVRAILAGS